MQGTDQPCMSMDKTETENQNIRRHKLIFDARVRLMSKQTWSSIP